MSASKSASSVWKKQTVHAKCVTVDCAPHQPIKDFTVDPSGCYVLIRVDREAGRIEAAICNPNHEIVAVFRGKKCQDVYLAIFAHETRSASWFQSKDHSAYLGKELKKAELALEQGTDYLQE
jgi:hypothetical protein